MKKTVRLNIDHYVFNLDEDAYKMLEDYLESIKLQYAKQDKGERIASEIERQVAKYFRQRVFSTKEVVTIVDVSEFIEYMGNSWQFGDAIPNDDEALDKANFSQSWSGQKKGKRKHIYTNRGKKLYRHPTEKVLAGVCSGIAAYLGIKSIYVRIICVFSNFIVGPITLILYVALAIILPMARTAEQRRDMQGNPIDTDELQETFYAEWDKIRNSFKNKHKSWNAGFSADVNHGISSFKLPNIFECIRLLIKNILGLISALISLVFKTFTVITGTLLIALGIGLVLGIFNQTLFADIDSLRYIGPLWMQDFPLLRILGDTPPSPQIVFKLLISPGNFAIGILGLGLTIFLPLVALVYAGIRLIVNFEANNKRIRWTGFLAWVIGLVLLTIALMREWTSFSKTEDVIVSTSISEVKSDTLYLSVNLSNQQLDYEKVRFKIDETYFFEEGENTNGIGIPKLDIAVANNDQLTLELRKSASGQSNHQARNNAATISYQWEQNGNQLAFNPFFSISQNAKWRMQQAHITLNIPEGKYVYLDASMQEIIRNIPNTDNLQDHDMVDNLWYMGPNGLRLID